jgi:hypothetical protein
MQRIRPICSLRTVPVDWKQAYRTALHEKDRKGLTVAVRLAEDAIQARLQHLTTLGEGRHDKERADLNTALRDLIALKAEYGLT